MNAFSSKNQNTRLRVVGIAVVVGSIAFVLFSGQGTISQKAVEDSLKRFNDYVAVDSAKSGKEGSFTYGQIEMKGFLLNRYALVHDISLEIKKQSLLESVAWSLSSPEMNVVSDPMSSRRLYYVFEKPIEIKKNGNAEATVTFSEPLQYGQLESRRNNNRYLVQSFKLPSSITITPTQGKGNVVVTYDANPTVEMRSSLEKPGRHAKYEFHNIAVTSAEEKPLSVGALKSELNEKTDNDNVVQGSYTLNVNAFQTPSITKPCDVNADIAYTGDQPLLKLMGYISSSAESAVNVKQSGLFCPDFKVTATGQLTRSPEDPLPSGQLTLKIDEVKQFLASPILSDQVKSVIGQVLVKVTGQPLDSLNNIELPLKREKNGTFYIGDVTFEEIATSLLSNMFGLPLPVLPAPQAVPVPETPADQQEKALPDPETTPLDSTALPPAGNETPAKEDADKPSED